MLYNIAKRGCEDEEAEDIDVGSILKKDFSNMTRKLKLIPIKS